MTQLGNSVTEMKSHLQASINHGSENRKSIVTEVTEICNSRDMLETSDVSPDDIREIMQDNREAHLKPLIEPLAEYLSNQLSADGSPSASETAGDKRVAADGGLSFRPGSIVFVSLTSVINAVLIYDGITNENYALLGLVVLLVCFSAYLATEFELGMEIK